LASAGVGIVCGEPNAMPSAAMSVCSIWSVATSTTVAGAAAHRLFFAWF
jgi:hypothetical protein